MSDETTRFQVWGARGSRNATGSRIGNHTSCYSLVVGEDLYIFDAGSGLLQLSMSQRLDKRLMGVRRVHILVTHAHWDHWEGLKDAEWFWRKGNGIELTVLGPKEALDAIADICQPPSFVKLEILALGTVKSLNFVELQAGQDVELPSAKVEPLALHHYSGVAPNQEEVCALGYRLVVEDGPTVVYLCDHEPNAKTMAMEDAALATANLAIVDASHGDIADHGSGHGSIESAAAMSRRFPEIRVLAAHHGAMREDDDIGAAMARHAASLPRLSLAIEGSEQLWDPDSQSFVAD